ncbi:MAG TPA: hypothetical protein VFC10_00585 [Terriglobia bacterium]|nr:hypothetical protein [Terriglobia bacterium]
MRAAVINVFAFLQFRGDGAAVVGAGQKACESEIVLAVFRFVPSRKSIQCPLEQLRRDQRLVGALVLDALPDEPANVERIFEHHFQIGAGNSHAGFPQNGLSQTGERILTGCVHFKDFLQRGRALRIDFDAAGSGVVLISEGSMAGINALLGLFPHSLLDFLAQILRIMLGHRNVDVMHKFVLRARVFRDHPPLFDQMNFDVALFDQLLEGNAVGSVSIEPVGFLDQHGPALRIGL